MKRKSADTRDKYGAHHEEVLGFAEVDAAEHVKTGNRYEAVQAEAHAAHYAARYRIDEGDDGSAEREHYREYRRAEDADHGSVSGDRHAADGFTVSGVGAAAECGAHEGTDAVSEKRSVQTGIGDEVALDDGADVLMVGDVLGENDESNGDIEESDIRNSRAVEGLIALGVQEGEIVIDEAFEAYGLEERLERAVIHYLEVIDVGGVTDDREKRRHDVTYRDTDDEGDEFHRLVALNGAEYDDEEGNKTAKESDEVIAHTRSARFDYVAHGVAGKGKTYQSDGGSDNDGRHEFVDPLGAREFDDYRYNDVNGRRKSRAEQNAEISERHGSGQRSDEGKGASEEDGAFEFSEKKIAYRSETCADQSGGGSKNVGAHYHRDGYRRGDDGEKLLNGKRYKFTNRRTIVYVVDQFHL